MKVPVGACTDCGTSLPRDAPEGRCPQCSLRAALGSRPEPATESGLATVLTGPLDQDHGALPRFGDYQLLEEIARGGMGVVYKARQLSLGRLVAVKMLLFGSLASKDFVQRFRVEASAAASLQHPNIVAMHEVGVHDNQHYLVMDYIAGQTLSQLSGGQPLPPRRAAAYLQTIAEAIHFAHEHGVLHRDLKPSNVLIDQNDEPHVTDFGLAKRLDADLDLTLSGQVLGSPSYMSPEQASGKRGQAGRSSDIYSLGAILFHLLTGRPPFVAESVNDAIQLVLEREPITPRALVVGLPKDLETICLKCLEKEPGKRYPTAQALADELRRFLRDEPIRARRVNEPEKVWRWCRRNPMVASLVGATLLLLVAVAIGSPIAALRIYRARQETIQALQERRRDLYISDMQVALQAYQDSDILAVRDLVKKHRPKEGEEDLRGFEWRYLWGLGHRDESLFTFGKASADAPRPGKLLPSGYIEPMEGVWAIAFSPDGSFLASGGFENEVRIWDVRSLLRRPVAILPEPGSVHALAFSRDRKLLASGTADGGVTLWELADPRLPRRSRRLPGHKGIVSAVVFAPGDQLLATGSYDGTVRLWDLNSNRLPETIDWKRPDEPRGGIYVLAFSPDGKVLALSGQSHVAELWDVARRERIGELRGHTAYVVGLAFAPPDGRMLATGGVDGYIGLWNTNGQRLKRFPAGASSLSFTRDGKSLIGSSGRSAAIWDIETGAEIVNFRGHRKSVTAVALSPAGDLLASASLDGSIKFWSSEAPRSIREPSFVSGLAFFPSWKQVATLAVTSISVWDIAGRRRLAHRDLARDPDANRFYYDLEILSDGKTVALTGTHQLELRDYATWTELAIFTGAHGKVRPDGKMGATVGEGHRIRLWDLPSKTELPGFSTPPMRGRSPDTDSSFTDPSASVISEIYGLAFSPDDAWLAAGDGAGRVHLWDIERRRLVRSLTVPPNDLVGRVAFSPTNNLLAASTQLGTVKVWRVPSGEEVFTGTAHRIPIYGLAFSPDGKQLATGSGDSTVRLWNIQLGRVVATFVGQTASVPKVLFTPDGNTLATGSGDGTVRLWQALSFAEIAAAENATARTNQ